MNKQMQKGFTLIELMIVVAIIAILAAIAIPQYQNYITKSQFSESQTIADGLKTPIVEFYNQNGTCPSNGSNGLAAAASYNGKYVTTATVGDSAATNGTCKIDVVFKSNSVSTPLKGETVTFDGVDNGGSFSWQCSSTSVADKYKPQACR